MRYLIFFLLAFASFANATPYTYHDYWRGVTSDSPKSTCLLAITDSGQTNAVLNDVAVRSDGTFTCTLYINGSFWKTDDGFRNGDSCAEGTTLNSATGSCDVTNQCAAKAGTTLDKYTWSSDTDMPPTTISVDGCAVSVTKARCSYTVPGKASCTGSGTYSGAEQAASAIGNASECTGSCGNTDLKPETKNQDCVYSSNGSGASTCTATNSTSTPGTSQCGAENGSYACIESPKATSNTSTLNSTKTATSNFDGTVTEVKDDTLTTTTCSGLRNCSSSTSTSTGTTVYDSAGNAVSSTSTCSGSNCTSAGTTKTPSDGADDSGDDSSSPSTSTLEKPEQGNFDGQESDWDTKIEKAKSDLKDGMSKFKTVFSDVGGLSISAGSRLYCPSPIQTNWGAISFCLDQYASSLSWIGSAFLLVCACIALFIVFT